MSDPFLGEIRVISFGFPPAGWASCDGQLLPINQNQALFALLGTSYGGDGRTTFALPDLRGRMPVHQGAGFVTGARGGESTHVLTVAEIPAHNHVARAAAVATTASPAGAIWAPSGHQMYASAPTTAMSAGAVAPAGGGQPHENRPPYLTLNFVIALQGIFPSQN